MAEKSSEPLAPKPWNLFTSADRGEALRYVIVRQAFVDCMVGDPQIQAAVDRWGDLFLTPALDVAESVADGDAMLLHATVEGTIAAFKQHAGELAAALSLALMTLKLDQWRPWLIPDLITRLVEDTSDHLLGREREREPVIKNVFVPLVSQTFETREWETVEDATTRLKAEFDAFLKNLATRSGRAPKGSEHLKRYARWFYEHCVKQPAISQTQLADAYCRSRLEEEGTYISADESTIDDGIKEARRLLSLTATTGK